MAAETIFAQMTALALETGALNLGQGFPDEDGPAEVVEAAVDALRAGHNQYAPSAGVPALLEAVAGHQARHYGIELDPAREVQITFGATEAIAAALLGLVQPGDDVLVLDPTYDSYGPIIDKAGGALAPIVLQPPHWRVEPELLERALTPRTRFLLLNSPHNPTGHVLDRAELDLLAAACIEHDLIAITDEVYEHLVFEGGHVPLATLPGMRERTLTISSLGKTFGLTGWKIGWASGPAELVGALRSVKQFLSYSGGTPLQWASAAALSLPDDRIAAAGAVLRTKRDRLSTGLTAAGFTVLPSQGTYFLSVDLADIPGGDDGTAISLRLPHEAGVVVIPMAGFRSDPADAAGSLIRFAFCKRDEVLDDAIARLAAWRAAQ